MQRVESPTRAGLEERLQELNLWPSGGEPWYDESAAYEFSEREIETLETAADTLETLIFEAVAHVVHHDRFGDLGIGPKLAAFAADSVKRGDPSVYGRLDLAWDGTGAPKLLEYNADTPTALLEAAVLQWEWLKALHPQSDQYNAIHEALVERWRGLKRQSGLSKIVFAGVLDEDDDRATLTYLEDTAHQAGWLVGLQEIGDLGFDGRRFVDAADQPLEALFKLYPWDWMADEPFFDPLVAADIAIMEAPWRVIASSKGLLAVLWDMFPGHPNLLPASFRREAIDGPAIGKALFGREGSGIDVDGVDGVAPPLPTPYDRQPKVWQAWHPLPQFDGWHPVLGLWSVGGEPVGMGIREDRSLITGAGARFRPHRIVG